MTFEYDPTRCKLSVLHFHDYVIMLSEIIEQFYLFPKSLKKIRTIKISYFFYNLCDFKINHEIRKLVNFQ